ncbi:MAG: hypothetical protein ACUVSI_01680 [Actinomycetota bacterium]
MEEPVFGEGWLDGLLGEPRVTPELRHRFREALGREGSRGRCGRRLKEAGRLLIKGQVGSALEKALDSLREALGALRDSGLKEEEIITPLVPALAGKGEIARILPHLDDLYGLTSPADDLETLQSLGTLNLVRRLLASWGACTWRGLPGVLRRLDGDLAELQAIREELVGLGGEEDLDKEAELAEHYAIASSHLARDLFELHLQNACHPEVRMQFGILWEQVAQLMEEGDRLAAAREAFRVLEEAFDTARLGGGDLLEMVDILYPFFSDPEGLRWTVDAMAADRGGADEVFRGWEAELVGAVRSALVDMGLLPT